MNLLMLSACVIGSDKYARPRDLAPAWLVDRTRVLAVVAEPPEVRPGETATFSVLLAGPPGDPLDLAVLWLACPVDDEGNGFGCATDLGSLDLGATMTPEQLEELGVIGFEPGLPPSYTVPDDLLDGLAPEDRLEGSYVLVQVTAFPLDALDQPVDDIDYSTVEAAYKRLIVSEAATPNHNPLIDSGAVDGATLPLGALVHLDADQVYEISVALRDASRERYDFVTGDGLTEQRVEEPYVSWFVAGTDEDGSGDPGGELLESVTLWPYLDATWLSPAEPGASGTWFAVLRDRRGGMTWWRQDWVVD